jgi:hypothetical protein
MTQSCRTPLESIQVRALRFMLSYLEDRGETSGRAYAFVNEALNTLQSETGMPGNGNTPTTREGSAAAPGKAGTEARQSLGDKRQQSERKKITYERGILRDEAGLELTVDELVDYANRAWRAYEAADRQAMENGERALALLRAAPVGEEQAFEDLLDDLEDVACRIEQSSGIKLGALMQERFDIRRQIHAARVTPSHAAPVGPRGDAYKRAYQYLQGRLESIGYYGWAHDMDGEIEDVLTSSASELRKCDLCGAREEFDLCPVVACPMRPTESRNG